MDTRPADQCLPAGTQDAAASATITAATPQTANGESVAVTAARPASTARLVLAGEATSVTHPATAHGAFLSGVCDDCAILRQVVHFHTDRRRRCGLR